MIHFLKKNSELKANKINTILGWTVMQTLNFLMIFSMSYFHGGVAGRQSELREY